MANQQRGNSAYGLDKQLADKALAKYDKQSEEEAKDWIEALTSHSIGDDFGLGLKSGVVLCDLANALDPSLKLKPTSSTMPFKQMENISAFLRACRTLGVAEFDLFETVDLFELKDVGLVVRCLHAVGRAVQKRPGYTGPTLGVKESTKNRRTFTHAQIAEARHATSLLNMGSITTMQRTSVDTSGSVTFGADSSAPTTTTTTMSTTHDNSTVPSLFRTPSSSTDPSPSLPLPAAKPSSIPPPSPAVNASVAMATCPAAAPVQVRGGGYGLDAELAAAASAKYDYALERSIQEWIEAVTHQSKDESNSFGEWLKDGQVLCLHVNTLQTFANAPPAVPLIKIESSTIAFKLMQNIKHFLAAARALGVADVDCFETVDLFELKDLGAVLRCLQALSRVLTKKFPGYTGPLLPDHATRRPSATTPPKPAVQDVREPREQGGVVVPPLDIQANPTRPSWPKPAPPAKVQADVPHSTRQQWPPAKVPDQPAAAPRPDESAPAAAAAPAGPIAAFRAKGLPTRTNWT
ncbi:hypothetical protein DYB37_009930 [Aphanomyces astaci]|uniref:Calponin-homology (CH) domain-containing protein n=1 Tax=Aphanomyces astaci TaxID=112090 RepID=A0A3R6XQ52_APHAT|nr:hypothetical protein DYB35_005751 [Aphanomyces astaci]RHZ13212.1 hypothetical protein DYB37_009930 [Aphanomyces astaci]